MHQPKGLSSKGLSKGSLPLPPPGGVHGGGLPGFSGTVIMIMEIVLSSLIFLITGLTYSFLDNILSSAFNSKRLISTMFVQK